MSTISKFNKMKNNTSTSDKNLTSKKNFCSNVSVKTQPFNLAKGSEKRMRPLKTNNYKSNDNKTETKWIRGSKPPEKTCSTYQPTFGKIEENVFDKSILTDDNSLLIDVKNDKIYTGNNDFGKTSPILPALPQKTDVFEDNYVDPPPGFDDIFDNPQFFDCKVPSLICEENYTDSVCDVEFNDIGNSSSPVFIPKSQQNVSPKEKMPKLIPVLQVKPEEQLPSIFDTDIKRVLTPGEILLLPKTSPVNEITDLVILLTRNDVSTQVILFYLNKIYLNRFVDVSYFFKNTKDNIIINITLGELFVHTMIRRFEITETKTILLNMFSDMVMRGSSLLFECSILDTSKKTNKYEIKRNSCITFDLIDYYTNLGKIMKLMGKNNRISFDMEEFNQNKLVPLNLHALMVQNDRFYTSLWSADKPKESERQYSEFIAAICYIKFVALVMK